MTTGRINQGASLELGSAVRALARPTRRDNRARATRFVLSLPSPRTRRTSVCRFKPPVIEMPVGDTFSPLAFSRARLLSKRRSSCIGTSCTLRQDTSSLFGSNGQDYKICSQTLRRGQSVKRVNAPRLDYCDTPILTRRPAYFPDIKSWSVFHSRSFLFSKSNILFALTLDRTHRCLDVEERVSSVGRIRATAMVFLISRGVVVQ